MKLKSYFSGTVEAAMDLARKELGDEALLVNARPATPETRSLGAYEVVFGVMPGEVHVAPPPSLKPVNSLAQDVAELRRELERMSQSIRGARMFSAPAVENDLYRRLIENEVDPEL